MNIVWIPMGQLRKRKERTISGLHLSQDMDLCVLETVRQDRPALEDFVARTGPWSWKTWSWDGVAQNSSISYINIAISITRSSHGGAAKDVAWTFLFFFFFAGGGGGGGCQTKSATTHGTLKYIYYSSQWSLGSESRGWTRPIQCTTGNLSLSCNLLFGEFFSKLERFNRQRDSLGDKREKSFSKTTQQG